jgi:hypothetical protein
VVVNLAEASLASLSRALPDLHRIRHPK